MSTKNVVSIEIPEADIIVEPAGELRGVTDIELNGNAEPKTEKSRRDAMIIEKMTNK